MTGAVGERSRRKNHMVSVADTSWDDCQLITILPMRIMQLAPLLLCNYVLTSYQSIKPLKEATVSFLFLVA